MNHIIRAAIFMFLVLFGTTAFAQTGSDDAADANKTSQVKPQAVTSPDDWKAGPLHSISLSLGAMYHGFEYGYGPVMELSYYKQVSDHVRDGFMFRWFHDNNHDFHYIGERKTGYNCVQIEMLTFSYQYQFFSRKGNWEYWFGGGFGLGTAIATYFDRTNSTDAEGADSKEKSEKGKKIYTSKDYWLRGKDWDIFYDVSMAAGIEYYFGKHFSLGAVLSGHYHTFIYIDLSASLQAKLLF